MRNNDVVSIRFAVSFLVLLLRLLFWSLFGLLF